MAYHLTTLLPYYGEGFCKRFAAAWSQAAAFHSWQTSANYFKTARKAFLLIGRKGSTHAASPEEAILRGYRDMPKWSPRQREWKAALDSIARSILNPNDHSFIEDGSSRSRNKKLESLRSAMRWLSNFELIPDVEIEARRIRDVFQTPSKCLATIKFEAGRLSTHGLASQQAAEKFALCNREMLEELRHQLWMELKAEANKLDEGERLINDPAVPSIQEAENLFNAGCGDALPENTQAPLLNLPSPVRLGLALKIFKQRSHDRNSVSRAAEKFARGEIKASNAQPYYEATTRALNAAFHIILIDVGANPQPIADLPYDCFGNSANKGGTKLRHLRLHKTRSGGKAVPGILADNTDATELFLATKGSLQRPSGVAVIELWKRLTADMRTTAVSKERLWVWRKLGWPDVRTNLKEMSASWWPDFLARHKSNSIFGQLPLTRRNIRTAVFNTKLQAGDLDLGVQRAMLGHSSEATSMGYLSEGATRSLLEGSIREFLNAWEAVSVRGIDEAAQLLGVPSAELSRRVQLGLENGLAPIPAALSSQSAGVGSSLAIEAREFMADTRSMMNLELARIALRQQYHQMLFTNPARFVRKWLPWMAIVEGYCTKLEESRFRSRFKKACLEVEVGLKDGNERIPLLW